MDTTPDLDTISTDEGFFFPEDEARLYHWQLALQSARIPYSVEWDDDSPVLRVPAEYTEVARQELASYDYNNIDWPPEPLKEPSEHEKAKPFMTIASLETALASLVILTGIHIRSVLSGEVWKTAGLWNAVKIRSGEPWRIVTALTLHTDEAHLASNLFWTTALLAIIGVDLGGGMAVLFMLLAGITSNLAMLFLSAEHSSLGASTMVFALVGLLCTLRTADSLKERRLHGGNFVSLLPWLPLFTGVVVFAFYGTAPGSDVLAHLYGLLSGLIWGIAALPCKNTTNHKWLQFFAGIFAISFVALALSKLP
ncbi:MAG: rhomboid family intramembrane serine protease [Victivallales bacterium]|nr:rhomboid family intramembrane serine protease [Victivallales bacterium]